MMTYLVSAMAWFQTSLATDTRMLRRMEVIRVQGADRPAPAVSVFAAGRARGLHA